MRKCTVSVFVLAALSLIAVPLAFGNGQPESSSGAAMSSASYTIGLSTKEVTNPWEEYFQDSFEWYSADNGYKFFDENANGDPAVQVTQAEELINRGINGLIVSAQDQEAAVPIVQYATEHKVPVFTADADIDSPDVKMYVGFSGERAGKELGQDILAYLQNKYGSPKGTVLEMQGPLGGSSAQQRSKGLHDVLDQYPNITIIQAEGQFQEQPAKQAAEDKLRANPNIDAVYGANGPMASGAVAAMQDLGIDPTKVYTATVDATPDVIDNLKKGYISIALDQAAGFYVPIAEYYLVQYLKNGDAGLPKVGTTVNASDLNLNTGKTHATILPWSNNSAWAPATITTENGHLWFQTGAVKVTQANAGDPSLWANVPLNQK